jgi:hypothetical protein
MDGAVRRTGTRVRATVGGPRTEEAVRDGRHARCTVPDMAQNTNTQTNKKPQPQTPPQPLRSGSNEHNEKEHQERLARQEKNLQDGTPGGNDHNRQEHEEKMKREGSS